MLNDNEGRERRSDKTVKMVRTLNVNKRRRKASERMRKYFHFRTKVLKTGKGSCFHFFVSLILLYSFSVLNW